MHTRRPLNAAFPFPMSCFRNKKHLLLSLKLNPQKFLPPLDGHVVELPAAVVDGHLAALAQVEVAAEALVDKVGKAKASPEEDARLAVLPEDEVLRGERRRRPKVSRLLAEGGHVEADATLPLRLVEDVVHLIQLDHL